MNNKIFQGFLIVCFALSSSTQINAQQKIPLYTSNQDCDINKNDRIVESDGSTYIYEVEYPEIWYYPAKNKLDDNINTTKKAFFMLIKFSFKSPI